MYIDQIPVRSKITISFDYVTKSTSLDAFVLRAAVSSNGSRSIVTDVVRIDGKIVNINNFRGKVSVRFIQQGSSRSELWKHVNVKYDRAKKEYIISTQKSSEKHERRKAPRIPLGVGATVQIEGDSRRRNCTIHDISVTGVGLRMEALNYKAIGKNLTVSFSDKSEFVSLDINCRCVREVNNEEKVKIYGCTLKKSQDLLDYIRKKQTKYYNTLKSSGRG
ncbi:MAG: PilZ domain-containing protein [Lachnospiraceae bacterium]|nr:PilZ domain-containing protein [Lachnospiraceae bacterium]MBR6486896.1 PilZ domain-containing protein [Lachnospiraceae bacterium]